jgi:hypothetical protein
MSRKTSQILGVVFVFVLLAGGCLPAAPPAAPPPPAATAAATVAAATTDTGPAAADPAGPNGQVLWNGAAVPGARVKLAKQGACRDADNAAVLATAVADAEGRFAFAATPAEEWDVCYTWPEGQGDGVYMIGERKPVMPVDDLKLSLTKPLRLLAPDPAQPIAAPVEVRWEGLDEAAAYRVDVSDLGTSELLFEQDVTGTSVTVDGPFKPGHGYQLTVGGLNAGGEQIAFYSGEFMAPGEATAPEDEPIQSIPAACYRPGLLTYVNRDLGLCFAYPQGYALAGSEGLFAAGSQAQAELRGPAAGSGPEPLFARLSLDFQPYQGTDLAAYVDEMIKRDVPVDQAAALARTQATWGGHAAEVLEPWPGQLSGRVVVVDVAPAGYHLLYFWPSFAGAAEQPGADARQAQENMEALYEIVAETFSTLPPPGVPMDPASRIDLPESCLVNGQPLYIDPDAGYCLALTPEMTAGETGGSVKFSGPAPDDGSAAGRMEFGLAVEDADESAALDKLVDDYVATLGEQADAAGREPVTVGGGPAVRLDGLPGVPGASEVLALHGGKLYRLRFTPGAGSGNAEERLAALVQAVTTSFGFLPAAQPAAEPAPAGPLLQSKPYRGVSFSYPASMALDTAGETVLSAGGGDGPWWDVAPQHVEVRLAGYALPQAGQAPRIAVYPASEYAALSPQAAEQIAALKKLLAAQPDQPEGELPFLPLMNAVQQVHLLPKYLAFQGGEGVSYLAQYGQGPAPLNNADLFYTFQGLTGDGQYYVSAVLPVSHTALPATAADVAPAELDALAADYAGYLDEVTATLAGSPATGFKPALADLDSLAGSIAVVPAEFRLPPGPQIELERDPAVNPDYTVEQVPAVPPADNINLYDAHPPLTVVFLPGYAGGQPSAPPYPLGKPAIQVYRVGDMQAFKPDDSPATYAGQYAALEKLLSEERPLAACSGVTLKPGQNMTYPVLPFVPLPNAAQVFCTQPAYVRFDGGKGLRYVTTFSQSMNLLSDQSVFYTFQGLTDDGQYYMSS